MRTGKQHVQMQEMTILREHLQFRRGADKIASRQGIRSPARPRAAEFVALLVRAIALHTRFLNAEDVFFLYAVVIDNAVPTIRVGAEATPPLGSD
jgi:hypothetical protein